MTFIITLIALMMERFFHWHHLRHWRWLIKYETWFGRQISQLPDFLRLIIILLPLLLIVGLLSFLLKGLVYGILELVFGVVVLLYCLGPDNLWVQVYQIMGDLKKDDPAIAVKTAKATFHIETPDNSAEFHDDLIRTIFIAANERIFAVIFWFVLVGPVGAVLYRLIEIINLQPEWGLSTIAEKWKSLLDWIPVRLLAFLFALGGHFTKVMSVWNKSISKGLNSNEILITNCGIAALDIMEEGRIPETGEAEQETLELLDRAFVIALVILAIIVIIF